LNIINAQEASNDPHRTKGALKQTLSDDHLIIFRQYYNHTEQKPDQLQSRRAAYKESGIEKLPQSFFCKSFRDRHFNLE